MTNRIHTFITACILVQRIVISHVSLLLVLFAACRYGPEPFSDQDLAEIRRVEQEYVKALLAGDVETILAQRTPDFLLMPQGAPVINAREALRESYRSTPLAFTLAPVGTEGRDDLAYNRGRWWGTWVSASDTVTRTGKYLQIWRREPDRSWLMALEMWNSDESQR